MMYSPSIRSGILIYLFSFPSFSLTAPVHCKELLEQYPCKMKMIQEVKNKLLFLLEMLEPFLDPAMTPMKNTIAFGGVSAMFSEKQEKNCDIALSVIRAAVKKPAVLPSLELEWRNGSVAPRSAPNKISLGNILLSFSAGHMINLSSLSESVLQL